MSRNRRTGGAGLGLTIARCILVAGVDPRGTLGEDRVDLADRPRVGP